MKTLIFIKHCKSVSNFIRNVMEISDEIYAPTSYTFSTVVEYCAPFSIVARTKEETNERFL